VNKQEFSASSWRSNQSETKKCSMGKIKEEKDPQDLGIDWRIVIIN
jgi:hypothetical protein